MTTISRAVLAVGVLALLAAVVWRDAHVTLREVREVQADIVRRLDVIERDAQVHKVFSDDRDDRIDALRREIARTAWVITGDDDWLTED